MNEKPNKKEIEELIVAIVANNEMTPTVMAVVQDLKKVLVTDTD